jgi:hypothetical protein
MISRKGFLGYFRKCSWRRERNDKLTHFWVVARTHLSQKKEETDEQISHLEIMIDGKWKGGCCTGSKSHTLSRQMNWVELVIWRWVEWEGRIAKDQRVELQEERLWNQETWCLYSNLMWKMSIQFVFNKFLLPQLPYGPANNPWDWDWFFLFIIQLNSLLFD